MMIWCLQLLTLLKFDIGEGVGGMEDFVLGKVYWRFKADQQNIRLKWIYDVAANLCKTQDNGGNGERRLHLDLYSFSHLSSGLYQHHNYMMESKIKG